MMKWQQTYGAVFLAVLFLTATTGLQVINHYCESCSHTSILPASVPHVTTQHSTPEHCESCVSENHPHTEKCSVSVLKVKTPFIHNSDNQEPLSDILTVDVQHTARLHQIIHSPAPSQASLFAPPLIYLHCQILI